MMLIFFFFAAIIGSIAGGLDDKPEVKKNTVLELTLNGEIPDRAMEDTLAEIN
ncbi:MAG: hypothetical protein ACK5CL_02135 [Sphingomonadales bacterium]